MDVNKLSNKIIINVLHIEWRRDKNALLYKMRNIDADEQ